MSKESLSERIMLEVILKYKGKLLSDGDDRQTAEKEINEIIQKFINKTGRKVTQIKIENENGQYKLLLDIK